MVEKVKTSIVPASRKTSFIRASEKGVHELAVKGFKMRLKDLSDWREGSEGEVKGKAKAFLTSMPADELGYFLQKLKTGLDFEGRRHVPHSIQIVNSGTLCALPRWKDPDDEFCDLQTVHAAFKVHGRPWHDCIRVRGEGGQDWYCEVRVLFRVEGLHDCMFVRWFELEEQADPQDVLQEFGCLSLQKVSGADAFDIIPLASALGKEYIIPNFKREGWYHVSCFKWERSPVALTTDKVDATGRPLNRA